MPSQINFVRLTTAGLSVQASDCPLLECQVIFGLGPREVAALNRKVSYRQRIAAQCAQRAEETTDKEVRELLCHMRDNRLRVAYGFGNSGDRDIDDPAALGPRSGHVEAKEKKP